MNKKFLQNPHKTLDSLENLSKGKKNISFATEIGKQKNTSSGKKVLPACLMHDLFGSIIYISLQRKVDMAQVLKYLLNSFLLSLGHVDEAMLNTPKSALLTNLETKGVMTNPDKIDIQIIDADFFMFTFTRISQPILVAQQSIS